MIFISVVQLIDLVPWLSPDLSVEHSFCCSQVFRDSSALTRQTIDLLSLLSIGLSEIQHLLSYWSPLIDEPVTLCDLCSQQFVVLVNTPESSLQLRNLLILFKDESALVQPRFILVISWR